VTALQESQVPGAYMVIELEEETQLVFACHGCAPQRELS
jgi:hypothetical protein